MVDAGHNALVIPVLTHFPLDKIHYDVKRLFYFPSNLIEICSHESNNTPTKSTVLGGCNCHHYVTGGEFPLEETKVILAYHIAICFSHNRQFMKYCQKIILFAYYINWQRNRLVMYSISTISTATNNYKICVLLSKCDRSLLCLVLVGIFHHRGYSLLTRTRFLPKYIAL